MKSGLIFAIMLMIAGPALAQTQPTTAQRIELPQLSEDDLAQLTGKTDAYAALLADADRGRQSHARYLTWVNPKTGPTGRERIIYGLYAASAEGAARSIGAARKVSSQAPQIERFDQAAMRLATAYEALIPVMNEAEGYYEREDYKSDKMAEGRALHAKLMPLFTEFSEAFTQMQTDVADVREGLGQQVLEKIEAKEGKSYRWHKRRIALIAGKAVGLIPKNPAEKNVAALDAAITEFAKAVKDFDQYSATATDKDVTDAGFDMAPRSLLAEFRRLRETVGKGEQQVFYDMSVNSVTMSYNFLVRDANRR